MSRSTAADVSVFHSGGAEEIDEVRKNFLDPSLHFDQRFLLLRDNLHLTISWARQLADSLIAKKLASEELGSEGACSSAIYYSKLIRAAFEKRAVWLTPSVESNRSGTFSIPDNDITAGLLLKSLEVPMTSCLMALAEGIVERVRDCGPRKSGELVERSAQVKTFVYDHHTNSFNAIITVLDIKLLISYRVMHKKTKEKIHEGLRGFAFEPLLDLGYGLQTHLTPSYLKSPAGGGGAGAVCGSPGYVPGSLVLNAEIPHRGRIEKERILIHVESEISMVQYEFSNNIFMELRDTIIEMISGRENNVTNLGD